MRNEINQNSIKTRVQYACLESYIKIRKSISVHFNRVMNANIKHCENIFFFVANIVKHIAVKAEIQLEYIE